MFHPDDHIRLMGCDTTRAMERRRTKSGLRAVTRGHDVNGFFERAGLSGLMRRK